MPPRSERPPASIEKLPITRGLGPFGILIARPPGQRHDGRFEMTHIDVNDPDVQLMGITSTSIDLTGIDGWEGAELLGYASELKDQGFDDPNIFCLVRDKIEAIQRERLGHVPGTNEQAEPREFTELREVETRKLTAFFEKHIDVPPLPAEVTVEKMKYWESIGFELHYLPHEEMSKDRELKAWKKPNNWFYDAIRTGNLPPNAAMLLGEWVVIDARPIPPLSEDYRDDILAPALDRLRARGFVEAYDSSTSRWNITGKELQTPVVIQAICDQTRINLSLDLLPNAIEFNVLGNIHHPEWTEMLGRERFQDTYNMEHNVTGGFGRGGGLAHFDSTPKTMRREDIGFRVIGRFHSDAV